MNDPHTTPPALLIAGHGTRVEAGARAAGDLAALVRGLLPGVRVEAGFVELTPPRIDEALAAVLEGSPTAVVVPLMIGEGGHVREDIPGAVDRAREVRPDATVVLTAHLGSPPRLVSAVLERIASACDTWDPAETDVVMVGRGCSVPDANADHVRLSRMVFEAGAHRQVRSAFIQVSRPSLTDVLRQYRDQGSRQIVVMPHFLFTGRLDGWVHEQVDAFRAEHPEVEVRVASVIGACDALAQVVAQRYREAAARLDPRCGSPAHLTGLLLAGRKVVVAGGGRLARRRVPALVRSGARVEVVSPELDEHLAALAASGALTWHPRPIEPADLEGAWYVLALTDSPQTNAAIALAAEARHTFCVRADLADAGSAWTPATGDVNGVTVSAITNHDPRRARRIRDRLVAVVAEESL